MPGIFFAPLELHLGKCPVGCLPAVVSQNTKQSFTRYEILNKYEIIDTTEINCRIVEQIGHSFQH